MADAASDHAAGAEPLTGAELVDALDDVLDAHPAGERVPYLSMIDGALAALLLSPEPVAPEEWLPRLLAGPDAGFDDPLVAERFPALLLQRQEEIRALLLAGGLAFEPIYDHGPEGEPQWQLWLAGFLMAVKLREDAWAPVFDAQDEDLATAALGILTLAATLPGLDEAAEGLDEIPDVGAAEHAALLLPYFVETIYRRLHGLERVPMDEEDFWIDDGSDGDDRLFPQQPVRVEKIGRNEPCPCGSGKKYKKCCGREA